MTYQARAALQVHSCAPPFWSQIQLTGERERRGIWTAFLLVLVLQGERRSVLKPHARIQLSQSQHAWIQPQTREKFYSKTALTDPRTDLHSSRSTQERDPSSQKNCPIVRMLIILLPLASVWGNPLYIVNSNGWKRENHSQSGKPPVHCSTRS